MTNKEIKDHNKKIKAMEKRNAKRLEYIDRFNNFFGFSSTDNLFGYKGGKNDKSK
jgi:hypothetical protein